MSIVFFLFFSLQINAQSLELEPVVVSDDIDILKTSRSVEWPVVIEKNHPTLNLPQPDDNLNSFNGLQVRTQGSPTFSIRGSAQNGRVLVLYNQIPLNFASGFGAPRLFLAKEVLGPVHIVKGPASLFYGSQAMAGAVNFSLKKYTEPEVVVNFSDTNESFLPWREGSLAHQSYQFATPIYQSRDTHIQTSLFYEDDDGAFPFQTANSSGVRSFNAQNTSRGLLSGETRSSWGSIGFDALLARQIQQIPGPTNFALTTKSETDGGLFSIKPHIFFTDHFSLRSQISQMQSQADFLENSVETYTDQTTLMLQNELIYDHSRSLKVQFFVDSFFHDLSNSFVGNDLHQQNFEFGPFLSFKVFPEFKHQLGFRFIDRNQKWLPTASTHWLPGMFDLWVSYAEGFRNPTLTDLYSTSPFFIGNPDLEAETSHQYELGIRGLSRRPFYWDIRIFHMEYLNFIESFEVTPGVFSRDNQGAGFSRGADLKLEYQPSSVGVGLDYNFLETRNRQQSRAFRLSPKHQLSLSGFYSISKFRFQVQNTHWYNTIDLSLNQPVDLEDWQQWNFYFHWQLLEKSQLSLGLINAFNEGKELTLNYPEPQRKFWLSWRQRF